MNELEEIARDSYERTIGLELSDIAVDCCIQSRLLAVARWRAKAQWTGERGA
jgi:hypothetical protein